MKSAKPPLLAIVGPTGIGKTALAVILSREIPMEVVSADSRQVYRGMDIGTGKPTPEERAAVPHHLIDVADPAETYHAARFRRDALTAIDKIRGCRKLPVVVGGTGLYLRALLRGLAPAPPADRVFRAELRGRAEAEGVTTLHAELGQIDPRAAARIGRHDLIRITRALEVFRLTGRPLSALHEWGREDLPCRLLMVGLTMERAAFYRRLERRCEEMVEHGLVDEVRRLLARGVDPSCPAMQGIGYRHVVAHLEGKWSLPEGLRIMQRDTKRYAKRQWTWFRKESVEWVQVSGSLEAVAGRIKKSVELQGLVRCGRLSGQPEGPSSAQRWIEDA